jgi:hypothetical protein
LPGGGAYAFQTLFLVAFRVLVAFRDLFDLRDFDPVANIVVLQVVRTTAQIPEFLECDARIFKEDLVRAMAESVFFPRVVVHRGRQASPGERRRTPPTAIFLNGPVRADGSEFAAPLFYRVYRLSSATDSNAEGEWATWVINRDVALPDFKSNVDWRQIKAEAVAFRESIIRGEVKADQVESDQTDSEGAM